MLGISRHHNPISRSSQLRSTRRDVIGVVAFRVAGSMTAFAFALLLADGHAFADAKADRSATSTSAGNIDPVPAGAKASADARRAAELYNAGEFDGAAKLYAAALAVSPYRGNQWDAYASALHNLGRYEESRAAWERCASLGFRAGESLYNCACAEARLGHSQSAVEFIARALENGYWDESALQEDEDLASIRSNPRFIEMTGVGAAALNDRGARWSYDLDFLATRIEQIHWSPFAHVSRDSLQSAFRRLKQAAPSLSDGAITVEIRRLIASIGDGHTLLLDDGGALTTDALTGHDDMHRAAPAASRYPFGLASLSDGVFVVRASASQRDLIGARVLSIGGMPVDDALARVAPFCSVDNAMGLLLWQPFLVTNPDVASAAGLTTPTGAIELEAERGGKRLRKTIEPEITASDASSWASMLPSDDALAPTLRDRDRVYWFAPLAGTDLMYVQFNQTRDDPAEPLSAFWPRLFAAIDSTEADGLVIDLRNNWGGNKALFEPLVDGIRRSERINQRDRLFVIVGRRTFSAAMCGAASLEKSTRATFVGEPTGSRPNFVGEIMPVTLPHSGLRLSISSRYHQNAESTDRRTWIGPQIAAPASSSDWAAGRDPAIEAIRAHVATATTAVAR